MCYGIITDNSCKKIDDVFADFNGMDENARKILMDNLYSISYKKLTDLRNSDNIITIPYKLHNFKENTENQPVVSFDGNYIQSYNIAGFINIGDFDFTIKSRFHGKGNNDYFLHYMLQKVFAINCIGSHSVEYDDVFSFLPYLFMYFLKKALSLGIYRKYERRGYNYSRIKGTLCFSDHIKHNIPFNGKAAYSVREHTADNDMTQLIRHTIEYVGKETNHNIFEDRDIKDTIFPIISATSSYNRNQRQKIILKNIKKLIHPYYHDYEPLRDICIKILRREKIKYGHNNNRIFGILIDIAWLWEEYLATIIEPLGFKHPCNAARSGGLFLLKDNKWETYPDFYMEKKIVADAKYKKYKYDDIQPADRLQLISYIHLLGTRCGIYLYPMEDTEDNTGNSYDPIGTLNNRYNELIGDNIGIYKYGFTIPNADSMDNFRKKIKKSEEEFVSKILYLIK